MADKGAYQMAVEIEDVFEILRSAINVDDVMFAQRLEVSRDEHIFAIPNFLPADICKVYYENVSRQFAAGRFVDYQELPPRFGLHNDEIGLALAYFLRPSVEARTGLRLRPSCTFCAIYPEGTELKRHVDRLGCEVTVAIYVQQSFAHLGARVLLNFGHTSCPTKFVGAVGDAVIFFGRQTAHWRDQDPTQGETLTTLLLHYSPVS